MEELNMDSPTPVNYKELWIVQLSTRKEYQLNGEQMKSLLEKMKQGDMGYFSIEAGGFKISQIVCWWLESRVFNENRQLYSAEAKPISEEERTRVREKFEKMRETVFKA